jgi:hypothetical protein
MSEGRLSVIVPPYFGVPRLSHQSPAAEVVVGAVVVTLAEVVVVVFLILVVVAAVVVDGDDVVLVIQDAKMRDATRIKVSTIQVIPLFIQTSFYFGMKLEQ